MAGNTSKVRNMSHPRFSCTMRVLHALSHGFLASFLLPSQCDSQIQSTNHPLKNIVAAPTLVMEYVCGNKNQFRQKHKSSDMFDRIACVCGTNQCFQKAVNVSKKYSKICNGGGPTILKPASNEMISDSALLSHIDEFGTNASQETSRC